MPSERFDCGDCEKVFTQRTHLNRHRRNIHSTSLSLQKCNTCNAVFKRRDGLERHMKTHLPSIMQCPSCLKTFSRQDALKKHLKTLCNKTPTVGEAPEKVEFEQDNVCEDPCEFNSALNNSVKSYKFKNKDNEMNHLAFMDSRVETIKHKLSEELREMKGVRWYIAMLVRFSRTDSEGETVAMTPCFRSKCCTLLEEHEIDGQVSEVIELLTRRSWEFHREGSGWNEEAVEYLELKICHYVPLAASSYIALPSELANKKAIINIQNEDERCFLWSVLAEIHPMSDNAHRVHKYVEWEDELNMNGIAYPVSIKDINKFEKQNNISVNVYGYEKEVFPLRITKLCSERHVDLLYITEGKKKHYCLIKNFNRLMSCLTKHNGERFYCHYCLHRFSSKHLLDDHEPRCAVNEPQKIIMPTEETKWMEFENHRLALKVPFVIYADFECFVKPVQGCEKDANISHSTEIAHHVPSGFAYVVVDSEKKCVKPPIVYRGRNVVDTFLDCMLKEENLLSGIKKCVVPIELSCDEENMFQTSEHCHICKKSLNNDRVRDHCHMTGKFRGAAHNACNLNYKFSDKIPVIFHNLRNYDSHLIMQGMGKIENKKITCIPNNMEKYISFSLGNLQFIDSFQFLNASLEQLVENLKDSNGVENFVVMRQIFNNERVSLLLRKGVFPYEYMTCDEKMNETSLPSIDAFYSSLTQDTIAVGDYEHALRVWDSFEIKNVGEYQDLYVQTDVLLLADVFENFRSLALEDYGIDPAHLYTAPGFAWQACLKMTGVKLELLTDVDMHLFIESGIRGGVSMISKRHSLANNKYMDDYKQDEESKYIMYWDCNNLYGTSMVENLPISGFRWLDASEIQLLDVEMIDDENVKGYILEVDLEYPENLHETHNCYPLAPERMEIKNELLSPFSQSLNSKLHITTTGKIKKLVPNLQNKENYVIHYKNLKQYIAYGMKLTKIHRVIEFNQSKWLKPFIDLNTEKRKHAKNEFGKNYYKLMNNSIYGKSLECLRKRVNVDLVTTEKKAKKLVASAAFEGFTIFANNLVAIKSIKKTLLLNRPIYAGFSILELSKTFMYEFHYSFINKKFGNNASLLFTDTDSLCYEIKTEDVYNDVREHADIFDTSNYPQNHVLFNMNNNKCLGKMKDEMGGSLIKEFIGLRPKMYSLMKASGEEKKVAKGVVRQTLKKKIRHEHYKNCLLNSKIISEEMYTIRQYKHEVYSVKQRKVALSPADDKRYLLDDGTQTLAYGHIRIKEMKKKTVSEYKCI